jgi:hypothetical protein
MDMFYDCYKSDAGKFFVVSGDKKTVMYWYHSYLDLVSGIFMFGTRQGHDS